MSIMASPLLIGLLAGEMKLNGSTMILAIASYSICYTFE